MTTTDDLTGAIAHRRRRAGRLMIALDQHSAIATWAAFHAELLTRMADGAEYLDAITATGVVDDPAMQRAWPTLQEHPMHVRAAQRVVEGCWHWVVGTDPLPADLGVPSTPEAVELEMLEIAAFTPAPVLLTESAGAA